MGRAEQTRGRRLFALIAIIAFSAVGFAFSAVSAYDFIAHLDRQVHPVSCSAVPGVGRPDDSGKSGCFAAMMSPYSSVFRGQTWGGVPIALPSMSVFAYLVFMAFEILRRRAGGQRSEMAYATAATSLPVAVSVFYLLVSILHVGTVCTNCMGIYIASAGAFAAALTGWIAAGDKPDRERMPTPKTDRDWELGPPLDKADRDLARGHHPGHEDDEGGAEEKADLEVEVGAGVEIEEALLDDEDELPDERDEFPHDRYEFVIDKGSDADVEAAPFEAQTEPQELETARRAKAHLSIRASADSRQDRTSTDEAWETGFDEPDDERSVWLRYYRYFFEGVIFAALPIIAYLLVKPGYDEKMGICGELPHPELEFGIGIPVDINQKGIDAIEILDPLCPACSVFRERLNASDLGSRLNLKAVLFPLDKSCNWMIEETLHPGACLVSVAAYCALKKGDDVIHWALDNQQELREIAARSEKELEEKILEEFPELKSCIGTSEARFAMNKALRWLASNAVPVLTPQLYLGGRKVCPEDTDLGLDFSLSRLIDAMEKKPLQAKAKRRAKDEWGKKIKPQPKAKEKDTSAEPPKDRSADPGTAVKPQTERDKGPARRDGGTGTAGDPEPEPGSRDGGTGRMEEKPAPDTASPKPDEPGDRGEERR